nr:callose synthase 3-like [Arachis hypogaea]
MEAQNIDQLAEGLLFFMPSLPTTIDCTLAATSLRVYGISWLVIFVILFVMKTVSVGRRKFSANFQLVFRLIKGLIFLTFVSFLSL